MVRKVESYDGGCYENDNEFWQDVTRGTRRLTIVVRCGDLLMRD